MRDRLNRSFERHPLVAAAFGIGIGTGFFAILLGELRDVMAILDFYERPGAGRESILRGLVWLASIAAMFCVAAVVQRKWWKKSTLRRWVLGALVVPPSVALLATAPYDSDPPGAGFCRKLGVRGE